MSSNFRDKNKLASKLFSNIILVVGELMVSAKMQIADRIEEMLVGNVVVEENVVKDS